MPVSPRTDAFRRWFRNSKIVDARGEPLVVYHGGFDVLNSRAGAFRRSAGGELGTGIYFTPDRTVAEYYARNRGGYEAVEGGALTEVYLSIQNPLVVSHTRGRDPAIEALVLLGEPRARAETKVERARERTGDVGKVIENAAVKADYDGILHYVDGTLYEIVAFQQGQVKSATANAGTYEFFDPDIRRNPALDVRPGIPGTYRTTFTDKGGRVRAYPAHGGAAWDNTLVRVADETTVESGRVYDTVKQAEHAGHASLRGKRGAVEVTRMTNPRSNPGEPFDALHAAAGPALRAWMDMHRGAVDSAMRGAEPARITQFASIAEAKEAAKSEAAFIVNEPAFRAWFGKSAVVDTQGKPLLVYHGTDAVFDSFAIGEDGVAYFTPDSRYGYLTALKNVIPAYLSIQRPYFARTVSQIEQLRSFPDAVEELKAEGYDGVIYANPSDLLRGPTGWGNDFPQIVVFRAGQIRSAVKQRFPSPIPAPPQNAPTGDLTTTPAFRRWFGASKVVDAAGKPLRVYHGTTAGGFTEFQHGERSIGLNRLGFWFDAGTFLPSQAFAGGEEIPRWGGAGNVIPVYLSLKNPKEYASDPLTRDEYDTLDALTRAKANGTPGESVPEGEVERNIRRDAATLRVRPALPQDVRGRIENITTYLRRRGWRDAIEKMLADLLPETGGRVQVVDNAVADAARERLAKQHDGIILRSTLTDRSLLKTLRWEHPDAERIPLGRGGNVEHYGSDWFLALHPTQIKSATGNEGTFDPNDPDIRRNPRLFRGRY